MRNRMLKLMAISAALCAFVACDDDDDNPKDDVLTVDQTPISFTYEGGNETFTITSNRSWTVASSETWLTVDKPKGENDATITVTTSAWDGDQNRTATVTVKGGDITRTVNVTQTPEPAEGGVPGKATVTGETEGETSVTLTANAADATSYAWYKGDAKIDGATANTYNATESGTYYAAGVNEKGEGEKSEGKVVTITGNSGDEENVLFGFDMEEFEDFDALNAAFPIFTNLDKDGDGNMWKAVEVVDQDGEPTGEISVTSASYTTVAVTPENYLVTPARTLGRDGKINISVQAQDPKFPAEKFKIIISENEITLGNCRDAEVLHTHTLADGNAYSQELDIPESYNGKTIYVGICHFDCTDQFRLNLLKIEITHIGPAGPAFTAIPTALGTSNTYIYSAASRK